jgi:hypothetical protein
VLIWLKGNDGKGNKLTTLLGEEKALAAIKAGLPNKDGRPCRE